MLKLAWSIFILIGKVLLFFVGAVVFVNGIDVVANIIEGLWLALGPFLLTPLYLIVFYFLYLGIKKSDTKYRFFFLIIVILDAYFWASGEKGLATILMIPITLIVGVGGMVWLFGNDSATASKIENNAETARLLDNVSYSKFHKNKKKESSALSAVISDNDGERNAGAFDVDDSEFYLMAINELANDDLDEGIWAMAYSSSSNIEGAEKKYVELRARQLRKKRKIKEKRKKKIEIKNQSGNKNL